MESIFYTLIDTKNVEEKIAEKKAEVEQQIEEIKKDELIQK